MQIIVTKTNGGNKYYIVKYLYKTKNRRSEMYINDRDQINYHGFLKALRRMQKATINQVAEGICSYSEISRVEIGDRLPEKLMRDRITSRLGISGEEYEEYLRPEEYRQWECRMRILDCINKGDRDGVKREIEEYDRIMERNPVQEQFLDTMKYMYMQMSGASPETLALMMELAILRTVPHIHAAFEGAQLLADQELNLILEYTYLREYDGEDEFEWRLSEYRKILNYVDKSHMDTISRSKLYPRIAYYVSQWILEENPSLENLKCALELCNQAIELLRDTSKLYYLVELLEYRQEILQRVLSFSKLEEEEYKRLLQLKEKDLEWENVLKELYTKYGVPIYMQNFTYLYVETECNSAVEVIRIRRKMVKMSRAKVSKNICTEKTVERFENYENSPSIAIVRDIFEKIGLCAEHRRARVITNNGKIFNRLDKMNECLNNWDEEGVRKEIEELKEILCMNIPYNKQAIQRYENLLAIREGKESPEELYNKVKKTLEYTISFEAIIRKPEIYLERTELLCVYDLAFKVQGKDTAKCRKIIEELCRKDFEEYVNVSRLSMMEILVTELASVYGNEGAYEKSKQLSEKLLKECLFHRRSHALINNLYNIIWNDNKIAHTENDEYKSEVLQHNLHNAIILSELNKKDNWITFLQRKISTYL